LAASLRVPVVSTAVGAVGTTAAESHVDRLREALTAIADRADRAGVIVTIETAGLDTGTLSRLLAEVNCPLLAACCDSGAMLMQGEDPARVAEVLPGRVRLVRARDAVPGTATNPGHEVLHGQGGLDSERFLAALGEAAFQGDIVLTRKTGANAAADLLLARQAFERHLA